jgi:hypothetical protein
MEWKDLPNEIQEIMLERQEEQTGKKDKSVFVKHIFACLYLSGFSWENTQEGYEFWEEILGKGNIDHFYTLYRKENPKLFVDIDTPPYYDNSKGTIYKIANERGWNAYLFDIVKRLERGGKKDPLIQEIDKSIKVLELWKAEIMDNK